MHHGWRLKSLYLHLKAKLQVDPTSGEARIVSIADGFDYQLRAYDIKSETNLLRPTLWETENLNAYDIDAAGPALGQSWDVVADTEEQLYEAYLMGGSDLAPTEFRSIGRIVDPFAISESPTLQFAVGTSDFITSGSGTILLDQLPVEFVEFNQQVAH